MATDRLDASSQAQQLISRLSAPIEDLPTLLSLLAAPLDSLSLLPPRFRHHNTAPLPENAFQPTRHISLIQRALIEHVVPTWQPALEEADAMTLVDQYFIPDLFMNATPSAGLVSLYAYSTILSLPLQEYSLSLLVRLSQSYPIDRLHASVFSVTGLHTGQTTQIWEDTVKSVLSMPTRVANALEGKNVPVELELGQYFRNLSLRCEALLASLADDQDQEPSSVTYLFTKMVNVGAFPPSRSLAPSQPSFFEHTLPTIRSRLHSSPAYAAVWTKLLAAIPSTMALQNIVSSLFAHLRTPDRALDTAARARAAVKREAELLRGMLGEVKKGQFVWNAACAVILNRDWGESHARIVACWAASAKSEQGLQLLLDAALDIWTSPEHIKHSLLSKHRYITLLVLLAHANLPSSSPKLQELAFSPPFIQSITYYISHMDQDVRRCGMLVAEEVARRAGKTLDFKDWDGPGVKWARDVRSLLTERDVDATVLDEDSDDDDGQAPQLDVSELLTDEIIEPSPEPSRAGVALASSGCDSDDSLTGYASPPDSERSTSPTPSELEEIEKDPTLNVGKKKIARPVYLAQLGLMLRQSGGVTNGGDDDEPDRVEVGLDVAEELIRRKRSYGTELEENAVNLVYALTTLTNKFELPDFDRKRQLALIALVACSPTKAAPTVVHELFQHQYSMDQRFVMLNALALGARELAGRAVTDGPLGSTIAGSKRVEFPSRKLPPALHARMLEADSSATARVQGLLEGAARAAIDGTREAAEERLPGAARERQLRLRPQARVSEVQRTSGLPTTTQPTDTPTFTSVAIEYFIYPLMNRFWLHVRDSQTRESMSAARDPLHKYRGAGTGLILSPMVLAHVLATLGVLLHCARAAPGWLALAAPDALELAVTLGTQPVSRDDDDDETGDGSGKEANVLAAALELALVILDGSAELDGGRTLALERTPLLLATGELAQTVFGGLEKGLRVKGGGGAAEQRLSRASAGVVLKVDEIQEKWRRSMVGL